MTRQRSAPIGRFVKIANPGNLTEISIAPDRGAGWLFRTFRFQFNTDANVATREIAIAVTDGAQEMVRMGCPTSQTAGIAREYSAASGANMIVATLPVRSVDWPDEGLWVPPGCKLVSVTASMQAADNYANIGGWVLEFPTGTREYTWPIVPYYTEEPA